MERIFEPHRDPSRQLVCRHVYQLEPECVRSPCVEYRFQSFDELKRISQELRTGQWGTEEYYDMVIKLIPRREVRTRAPDQPHLELSN